MKWGKCSAVAEKNRTTFNILARLRPFFYHAVKYTVSKQELIRR